MAVADDDVRSVEYGCGWLYALIERREELRLERVHFKDRKDASIGNNQRILPSWVLKDGAERSGWREDDGSGAGSADTEECGRHAAGSGRRIRDDAIIRDVDICAAILKYERVLLVRKKISGKRLLGLCCLLLRNVGRYCLKGYENRRRHRIFTRGDADHVIPWIVSLHIHDDAVAAWLEVDSYILSVRDGTTRLIRIHGATLRDAGYDEIAGAYQREVRARAIAEFVSSEKKYEQHHYEQ